MQLAKSVRARRARGSRGQALVELALVVPIMAVLFLATIDLGRVFYSQITITNAAREAAFKAAEDPTSYTSGTCDATTSKVVCAAINEARNSFVTVSAADVSMTCTPACTKSYGNRATVTVLGHFNLLTPLMGAFTGGSNITLTSTASADVVVVPAVVVATPTPTPLATPTPVATPTPTPDPGATPTPTPAPTPTPIPCAPPYAAFTYSQQNKNKPVLFTSTSTPTTGTCKILYWRWNFGDGALSTGNPTSISHSFATKGGTYTVALTVTVTGGVTTTTYVTITTLS
jgi:Flp pilus assembly protein TadG